MNGIFGLESPVMRGLSKAADLMILNIVFLITCIPLFTIGAATTSMYEITLKMVKNEESYIVSGYFKAFKSNFKKSTGTWIVFCIAFTILIVDLYVAGHMDGDIWQLLYYMIGSFGIILLMLFAYVFPLQAKFINTFKNTWKNAAFMMIKHFPTTVLVVFCNSVFVLCMIFNGYTFIYGGLAYLVFGFALIAYINSIYLVKVFEKYYDMVENNVEVDVQV